MSRLHGRRDGPGGTLVDWVIDCSLPPVLPNPLGPSLWLTAPASYQLTLRGLDHGTALRVLDVAPDAVVSYSYACGYGSHPLELAGIQLTAEEMQAMRTERAGPLTVLLRREQAAWPDGYRLVAVPDALDGYP